MAVEKVFDGYKVTVDENGVSSITLTDEPRPEAPKRGFWEGVREWWKGLVVKPCVKVVDLNDPTGERKANGGPELDDRPNPAVVIGVEGKF